MAILLSFSGILPAHRTWSFFSFSGNLFSVFLFYLHVRVKLPFRHPFVPYTPAQESCRRTLLNYHLLLASVNAAFRILRRDRNQAFPVRQGRREIVEGAIVGNNEIGRAS